LVASSAELCQEQKTKESDEKSREELIATLIAGPVNSFVDVKKLRKLLERDKRIRLIDTNVCIRSALKAWNTICLIA
jgi:hypothetical protein